jgi:hypothetical protein
LVGVKSRGWKAFADINLGILYLFAISGKHKEEFEFFSSELEYFQKIYKRVEKFVAM